MIGFCTVETIASGSADFRIAKSVDARDVRQSRQACYGMDSCGASAPSTLNPAYLTSTTTKNIHHAIIDQPDFVQCTLVSDTVAHLGDLEILLRPPGDPLGTQMLHCPPLHRISLHCRRSDADVLLYLHGEKGTIASSATTRWYIDVSFNQTSGNATDVTTPPGFPYGSIAQPAMACQSLGSARLGPQIPDLARRGRDTRPRAVTLDIRSNCYRLKKKLRAGLVRTEVGWSVNQAGNFRFSHLGKFAFPLTAGR